MKYLRNKPVRDLKEDEYLRLAQAEEDRLLELKISVDLEQGSDKRWARLYHLCGTHYLSDHVTDHVTGHVTDHVTGHVIGHVLWLVRLLRAYIHESTVSMFSLNSYALFNYLRTTATQTYFEEIRQLFYRVKILLSKCIVQ